MELTKQDVQNLAKIAELDIPESDLNTVAIRLASVLSMMEQIEKDIGEEMDRVDPIPPVYPSEDI